MKNLIIALCMITMWSCKKESVTQSVPSSQQQQDQKLLTKKIKTYLCTNLGTQTYTQVFKFHVGYRTNVAATDTFTNALWFAHHKLSAGDTSLAYLYPYAVVNTNTGSVYAYPDSALQADPSFADFTPWFQKIVSNWMNKHECSDCSNTLVGGSSSQFFTKVSCNVNVN